jgi:hypothetical protein
VALHDGVDMAPLNSDLLLRRVTWSCKQWMRFVLRRFGVMGVSWGVITFMLMTLLTILVKQNGQISMLQVPQDNGRELTGSDLPEALAVARDLNDFQKSLLRYGDIPDALRDLIVLAQKNNLVLSRGEYQMQIDQRGQFMRYQMVLPVRGQAPAVERFILEALLQHKTMALESVQFKREGASAKELEAKVQWVLMVQLPLGPGVTL